MESIQGARRCLFLAICIAVPLALPYKIVYYLTKNVKSSIKIEAINLSVYTKVEVGTAGVLY
jgi:hypothetical protein